MSLRNWPAALCRGLMLALAMAVPAVAGEATEAWHPPGCLAFSTLPDRSGPEADTFWWLPVNGDYPIACFGRQEQENMPDFSQLEPGTVFIALAAGYSETAVLAEYADLPYGGDGGSAEMALFSAPRRPPAGPVWLVPAAGPDTAAGLTLERVPLERVSRRIVPAANRSSGRAAVWRAGPVMIVLQRADARRARLTLLRNGRTLFSRVDSTYAMGDAPAPPFDLHAAFQPGISRPLAAFNFSGAALPTIVIRRPGYEGNSFELLAPYRNRYAALPALSLYYMAY